MCRADVDPAVHEGLAAVLDNIAAALAQQAGISRDQVLIGPVDFGPEHDAKGDG